MTNSELKPVLSFLSKLTDVNYAEINHANEQLQINCSSIEGTQYVLDYILSLNIKELVYDSIKKMNSGNRIVYFSYN